MNEIYWRKRYNLPFGRGRVSQIVPPGELRWFFTAVATFSRCGALRSCLAAFAVSGMILSSAYEPVRSAWPIGSRVQHETMPQEKVLPKNRSHVSAVTELGISLEASMIALRGYLLTDEEGFGKEWERALERLRSSNELTAAQSVSWQDGDDLLAYREIRTATSNLVRQQQFVARLAGTENRYPGKRVHKEHIDPGLARIVTLCDTLLEAELERASPGKARIVSAFAEMRGDVKKLRHALDLYLTASRLPLSSAETRTLVERLERMPDVVSALRYEVPPAEQLVLQQIGVLIDEKLKEIKKILELRESPRWDYADFVFKQKILPETVRILDAISKLPSGERVTR